MVAASISQNLCLRLAMQKLRVFETPSLTSSYNRFADASLSNKKMEEQIVLL
jgi:hypothetical protein